MARTIAEIEATMINDLEFSELTNTSPVAEHRLWIHIVASGIYLFELIQDMFKTEISTIIDSRKTGTLYWYAEKAYEFQLGDELRFDSSNNRLYYGFIDEGKKIIKRVSVTENDGIVTLKVAKEVSGELAQLSDTERLAFENYMGQVKYAGVRINTVSLLADVIETFINIYFNPIYSQSQVSAALLTSLESYRSTLPFDGVIVKTKLLEAVLGTPGVISANIAGLTGSYGEPPVTETINFTYELRSGYFNWSPACEYILSSIIPGNS